MIIKHSSNKSYPGANWCLVSRVQKLEYSKCPLHTDSMESKNWLLVITDSDSLDFFSEAEILANIFYWFSSTTKNVLETDFIGIVFLKSVPLIFRGIEVNKLITSSSCPSSIQEYTFMVLESLLDTIMFLSCGKSEVSIYWN